MKKEKLAFIAVVVLLFAALLYAADEKPWFDMKNCEFCKNLLDDPKLLDNMTWKIYDISDGILTVSTVKPEYQKSYDKASKAMETIGMKMMSGEINPMDVKMCGSCEYYGKLMMMGAKMETIKTDNGDITLMRSDKPELVKMIQEYGHRSNEAMAEMDKAEGK